MIKWIQQTFKLWQLHCSRRRWCKIWSKVWSQQHSSK